MDPLTDGFFRHLETALLLPLCLLAAFFVHEMGHYIAARVMRLRVESVTFGRGAVLCARTDKHGTLWRLHLWPLRAHVQIAGFEHNESLSLRKKLFVVMAGPLANFMLPVLLFFLFFALVGKPAIPNIVTALEPDMPAYKAGIRPGDTILSIDGEAVRSMDDIIAHTHPRRTEPLRITYGRGDQIYEASVLPVWTRYRDIDGVSRAHGRIGLTTWQQAYHLKVVKSVAGVPTPTVEEARAALLQHMDTRVEIGLWSMDAKVYNSIVDLSGAANRHLANPAHRKSDRFYMGSMRDNLYLAMSPPRSAAEAAGRTMTMIGHVALLPFNLFPIDKQWITPDAVVSGETSLLRAKLYVFVFFASLSSCFIGLLNLIPFPRLDGGEALLILAEAHKRHPLLNTEKATVIVLGVLLFYAAVFGANMGDMRGYYLFQMKKASAAEHAYSKGTGKF